MVPAIDLSLVLAQYNRHLGDFRGMAQKVIAAIAGYAVLHAGSRSLALSEKTYTELFLFGHLTVFVFVVVIGSANYLRMASSHRAVLAILGPEPDADLARLGILRREPLLVALTWGSLYLIVHGTFLIIVHLVR